MTNDNKYDKLKSLLEDQHTFPTHYLFKFIVPVDKENEVRDLFQNETIKIRPSSKGTYVSVSCECQMASADDIIGIYKKASLIKGLISL